jgi:hypothetical protein
MNALTRSITLSLLTFAAATGLGACTAETQSLPEDDVADLTSNDGKLFDFAFMGEVLASKDAPVRESVIAQLQYIQGMLTTDVKGNGQIGFAKLTGVTETREGEKKRIKYTATVPVVWPKERATPKTYTLALPADVSGLDAFNAKYDGSCGVSEYGQSTFWHDFNPKATGCKLGNDDAISTRVTVKRSAQASLGKLPEYAEILKDDVVDIVAVFGSISNNSESDEGSVEMENVLLETAATLKNVVRKDAGQSNSVIKSSVLTGDVSILGKNRKVSLTALFISELSTTGKDFDDIYVPASEKADLIVYSGHSGLGANINALAEKTRVAAGKYQMLYLNGCQSFAYMGRALHDKKISANGPSKDPNGTKFLDVVANALPAYGDNGSTGLALYTAILKQDRPQSYNDILKTFSRIHLAAVFGEEDNTEAR